jgi:glutathione-independent formaldehyde dehydrogenase
MAATTEIKPGAADEAAKEGSLSLRIGLGFAKSHAFFTGKCPVMRYNRQWMIGQRAAQ